MTIAIVQDRDINAMHRSLSPSPWVVRHAGLATDVRGDAEPGQAPILDLACGGGRHTRLFLDLGHPVTAVDIDVSGLDDIAASADLTLVECDLEAKDGGWPLGGRQFHAVIVTNYLWRPLLPKVLAAVADGGVLIYETFGQGNEKFGKPRNPDFLLRPGELLELVRGELSVVAYEHGVVADPKPAIMQRICAVRAEAPARLSVRA